MNTVAPRIKVCCIASVEEARLAIAGGADALGLVSEMPSGPGPIPEERIREIAAGVPRSVRTFLLTSKTDVAGIAAQVRRVGVTTVQIVDHLIIGTHRELRQALPETEIVQVIHVRGEISVDEAMAAAPFVDAVLLDSGNPGLAVKELGRTHDWAVSRRIRDAAGIPVWLAGGLNSENVGAAINAVRPYGVDICSGIRSDGRLDQTKLADFVGAVRSA